MGGHGLSVARLRRLDRGMAGFVERGDVAGVLTLVHRRGGEAHFGIAGWRDIGAQAPLARETIFRIASMTKPTIGVAALILVEEGRLRLTEAVDRWLPELANPQVLRTTTSAVDDCATAPRLVPRAPGGDVRKVGQVETQGLRTFGRPRIGGDVGDREFRPGQPWNLAEAPIEHAVETMRLGAVARRGTVVARRCDVTKMRGLAEYRAHAGHLEHQPLSDGMTPRRFARPEFSGLVGRVEQDGAGFEHREGVSARAIAVDDRRPLGIGVERKKFRRVPFAGRHAHGVHGVGQFDLGQHERDFPHVRAAAGAKVDHVPSSAILADRPVQVERAAVRIGKSRSHARAWI